MNESFVAADLKDLRLIKQFYHLTMEWLSEKMCIFGLVPGKESSPYFYEVRKDFIGQQ